MVCRYVNTHLEIIEASLVFFVHLALQDTENDPRVIV